MGIEKRIYGPPGTGKTTKLSHEIVPMLADKYGNNKLMLTSFTKAAAKELGQRISLDGTENIGTLHSICLHALGRPALTEKNTRSWDEQYPLYAFGSGSDLGKECYSEYQIYRNKIIDRDKWRPGVFKFAKAWEDWKQKEGLMDFIDLIEEAGNILSAPGLPSAIVVDEAQDFTRLEMKLLRHWAMSTSEFWLIGDDDQCIYSFSGADPRNMLFPEIPESQKEILQQSWRVPKSVHKIAENVIRRVKTRQVKEYRPKNIDGSVMHGSGTYQNPSWMIQKAIDLDDSSMILVSCNYMLHEIIKELRDRGIPFSNPWKKDEKSWNPLNTKGTRTLVDFLDTGEDGAYWSTPQFLSWAEHVKIGDEGLIRKKGKAGITQLKKIMEENPHTPGLHTCREYIHDILNPAAIDAALKRDTQWLLDHITKAKLKTIDYPLRVFKKNGKDSLFKTPQIHVGTVHSVKGGEASNVFLYPDISFAASKEMENNEGYENLCRLFYVGITRSKNNLVLMPPVSHSFFNI